MRISDWSSDVCSSDLLREVEADAENHQQRHHAVKQPLAQLGQMVEQRHLLVFRGVAHRGHKDCFMRTVWSPGWSPGRRLCFAVLRRRLQAIGLSSCMVRACPAVWFSTCCEFSK